MTPRFRKFLYLFFILLFFIITPITWSIAAGYRFNFSKMSLQKTGMLIINSEPEDAVIYINDKKIQRARGGDTLKPVFAGEGNPWFCSAF